MTFKKSHEIITITYSADLPCLLYHVLSLSKFWNGDKNFSLVVEDGLTETIQWCEIYIRPILRGWNVNIYPPPDHVSNMTGWYKQQLLKLWAASISKYDYSVVLDCKNILIHPYSFENNFKNGKLLVKLHKGDAYSENCPLDDRERMLEAGKIINKPVNGIPVIYPITPFIWDNLIVRNMLAHIEKTGYKLFQESDFKYYESNLYWVYAFDKILYQEYDFTMQIGQYGGIVEEQGLTSEQFKLQLEFARKNNIPVFSIHRFHLTPEKLKLIEYILEDLGIIRNFYKFLFRSTFRKFIDKLPIEVQNYLVPKWKSFKTIIKNNKTIKFNRLVVYGCSFTSGEELADHKLVDNVSCNVIDNSKKISLEKNNKKFSPLAISKFNFNDFVGEQKASSWAFKLADKFDVDFLNRAEPGTSLQYALYQIQYDLTNGILSDDDLIIVGLTSEHRWLYFNDKGVPLPAVFGYENLWPSKNLHSEMIDNVVNDYFILYNYFNCLQHFELLSKKLNNRLLGQFLHHTWKDYISYRKHLNLNLGFLNLINSIECDFIIDKNYAFGSFINWNTDTHGYWHPREEFHEIFAEYLYKKLINKNE